MEALRRYISDRDRLNALAMACGTKPIYLRQIACAHRRASPRLTQLIELHTHGAVSRGELRPDIYGEPIAQPNAQQVA